MSATPVLFSVTRTAQVLRSRLTRAENGLPTRRAIRQAAPDRFECEADEEVCVVSIAVVDVAAARPIPAPR